MDQPRCVDPALDPSPFGDVDSDAELLKAFAAATPGSTSAQAVLTEIVARHGTMVYQVAQRMVNDPTLVDDVFQATFLVLAQSARKIQKTASLASWLHGTARNIGRRALNDKYGVRSQTTTGVEMVTAVEDDPFTEMIRSHERQLLDEELQQLPEIYRAPLVLHYFEQRSNPEISQWLGITVAAVESRLKRAKQLLRARLVRRGMTLSVAVAALGASSSIATATPSVALVTSTVTLAVSTPAITASLTAVAASAALQLAGKELATMSAASKITALLLSAAGTLTLGGAVLFGAAYGSLNGEGRGTGLAANGIDPVIADEPEFGAIAQIQDPIHLADRENTPKSTAEVTSDALKTALKREMQFDIPETTLKEALEKLSDECNVTFVVPHPAELGASLNSRVKLVANEEPLGSVLDEMLANVDGKKLNYGISQGVIAIDSADNLGGSTKFMERMQYVSRSGWKTLPPQATLFSAAVGETSPKTSAETSPTATEPSPQENADIVEKVKQDTQKIRDALDRPTTFEFIQTPLKDALASMSDKCGINIKLDTEGLKDIGINEDTPIDMVVKGITLKSSLKLLLDDVDGKALDYILEDGALVVGSIDRLSRKVNERDLDEIVQRRLGATDQPILNTLDDQVDFNLPDTTLAAGLGAIADKLGITIVLDSEGAWYTEKSPVSLVAHGIPLRAALSKMLSNVDGKRVYFLADGEQLRVGPPDSLIKAAKSSRLGRRFRPSPDPFLIVHDLATTMESTGAALTTGTPRALASNSTEGELAESSEKNTPPQTQPTQGTTTTITAEDNKVQITTKDTQINASELRINGSLSKESGAPNSEHRAPILSSIRNLTAADRKVYEALDQTAALEFPDNLIGEVTDYISSLKDIRIRVDWKTLIDEGITPDASRVNLVINDVPLSTSLSLLLESVDGVQLDYYVDGGILMITTAEKAREKKSLRFYDLSCELVNLPEVIEAYARGFEADEPGTLALTSFGDCLAIETSFEMHKKIEEMIVGVMQVAEARKAAGKELVIPKPKPVQTRPAPAQPTPAAAVPQQPAGAVGGSGSAGGTPAGNGGGGFIGGGGGGFN